jgi:hypothetical protein
MEEYIMKTRIFALVIALILMLALAACNGGNSNTPSNGNTGNNGNSLSDNQGIIDNDRNTSTEIQPQRDTSTDSNLSDYTEIRVIVSGVELDFTGRNTPILKDGEVLSDEYDFIFANLKDERGANAGFSAMIDSDMEQTVFTAVIGNEKHNLIFIEGEEAFTHNGKSIPLAVPAQRIDGSFMIPMIVAASAIGILPALDESEQTLTISYTLYTSR